MNADLRLLCPRQNSIGCPMTVRNLDPVFNPKSIAIIGASTRQGAVGRVVVENVINGGFKGPIWPVNRKYREVSGLQCYGNVDDLPEAPDLAVIITPPQTVPGLIADLGAKGTRAVVVLTAGITAENGLRQQMLDAAKPHLLRIVGPNTLGLLAPNIGFNASFAHMAPRKGKLALLSQSGAIATSLIDWAADQEIGFSHIISLGDMADVDVGDCLDMLAMDRETDAILMYLESIPNPRKFISAARAVARMKPVIAIKSGRHEAAAKAAATHTGALSGADRVVDAALRRAGVLRVRDLEELFIAAETIARFPPLENARVGIVTNGGGAGVLAIDQLADEDSELAELTQETLESLNAVLPATWSHANPVDIIGDAPPERYRAAIKAVAEDPGVDALLVMNCPTALASPVAAATAITELVEKSTLEGKPVLACWLGEYAARAARNILHKAGVASFDTPAEAARAIGFLNRWNRVQKSLKRVPASHSDDTKHGAQLVADIFAEVAAEGRQMLTEPEAKAVVGAYGIAVPEIHVARDADEVGRVSALLLASHQSVVVKLLSKQISHKSDIGGVVLDLETAEAAHAAARDIMKRVHARQPEAVVDGFAVQPMVKRKNAHELIIGMSQDPIFGPILLFGTGGTAVEVIADTAIALPPMDDVLGSDLIDQTRVGKLLAGYRDRPAADKAAILAAINSVSQLAVDFPCITGIDINPLLADEKGVVALDARVEINPARVGEKGPNPDLVIRSYPGGWEKQVSLQGGVEVHMRPIRPDDIDLYPAFLGKTSPGDMRLRLFASRAHFPQDALKRLTLLDYDREMAFVALMGEAGEMGGIARLAADPDHETAEFAVLVRSDLQGRGLGWTLLEQLIAYARADRIQRLEGFIFRENTKMLSMCRELGFSTVRIPDDPTVCRAILDLGSPDNQAAAER